MPLFLGLHANPLALGIVNRFRQHEFFAAWLIDLLQRDAMFESLRNEPEFTEIVQEIANKGQETMRALVNELELE